MPNQSEREGEHEDIPELDDIVEAPGDKPPPNLDLFGKDVDLEALHDALMARMNDEIDVVVAELHVALEETVRRHFEVRLRDRLPAILDDVLGSQRKPE